MCTPPILADSHTLTLADTHTPPNTGIHSQTHTLADTHTHTHIPKHRHTLTDSHLQTHTLTHTHTHTHTIAPMPPRLRGGEGWERIAGNLSIHPKRTNEEIRPEEVRTVYWQTRVSFCCCPQGGAPEEEDSITAGGLSAVQSALPSPSGLPSLLRPFSSSVQLPAGPTFHTPLTQQPPQKTLPGAVRDKGI